MHGFEAGAGLAFSVPFGEVEDGLPLSSVATGLVPLEATAGYRFESGLYVGGYLDYGWMLLRSCALFESCSSQDLRFGLEGRYYFPGKVISAQPWIGLGAGYEIATESADDGSTIRQGTDSGFELVRLLLGADFGSNATVAVGPFLGIGVDRYSNQSLSDGGTDLSGAIASPKLHFWASAGVRLRFGPF